MKKIALGVGIVLGVIILILAVLPFAIDLNKHKETILTRIKAYTNRQVDFESINLTILTGLGAEIKDLHVSDDPEFSSDDFLSLKAAQVKVAILPLLKRKIEVRKIVLKEPRLHIIRNNAGVFNFKTLLIPKPGEKPKEKAPKPGALASLLVSNVDIKQGVIMYRDDKIKPGSKPFAIRDIDLESQDISVSRPIPFSLSASVMSPGGQNFALAGTIGPIPGDGELSRAPIDVHLLIDSLPLETLPVKMPVAAGSMKVDIMAKGTLKDKITAKTLIGLTGLVFSGPDGMKPAKAREGISCQFTSDLALELEQQRLLIGNGMFTLGQDRGSFEGVLQDLKTAPAWNISLKSDRITPGSILAQMPVFVGLIPDKITVTGPAGIRLNTTGGKEAFQVSMDVDMKPMGIAFGKIFNKPGGSPFTFSSRMTMKKETIEITAIDFNLGAITAQGSGEVRKVQDKSHYQIRIRTNPVPLQTAQVLIPMLQTFKPSGNIVIKTSMIGGGGSLNINVQGLSDHMGLILTKPPEVMQPKGKLLAGPVVANLNGMTLTVDALKKDKGLSANGIVKSRQGSLMDLPFTNLTGTFSYAHDQFTMDSFELAALKGSIKGSASYNLKTKAWSANPVFNNVQAGNVLDALSNFKGIFTGTLTGDVKARGVAGAPAMENLGVQANLRINQGEWKNFDLAGGVLGKLLGVPGVSEAFGLAPAEIQRYQNTRFETMNAQVDLARKVINVDTIQLLNISSGKDVDTESRLKGTISMETNQLDLKGQVVLPKRFSQRIGTKADAFSTLMNDQNRLVLPLIITGSLNKPIPMVEVNSLTSALARYYTTRALDKGLKKLQDKAVLPPGAQQDTGKAIENLLDGLLKKK